MRQSRITVLTRLLEDSYIKYNRLTEQMQIKKTNFKININNVCDKVIYLLYIHQTSSTKQYLFLKLYFNIFTRLFMTDIIQENVLRSGKAER